MSRSNRSLPEGFIKAQKEILDETVSKLIVSSLEHTKHLPVNERTRAVTFCVESCIASIAMSVVGTMIAASSNDFIGNTRETTCMVLDNCKDLVTKSMVDISRRQPLGTSSNQPPGNGDKTC
jgi:hypothetical protein